MKKISILSLVLFLAGCSPQNNIHRPSFHKMVNVIHTSDNRYAYLDDSGIWWWYMIGNTNNYYTGSISSLNSSVMVRGLPPTPEEEENDSVESINEEFTAEGQPETEATAEGISEGSSSTAASSDSGSSSSSSDGGGSE